MAEAPISPAAFRHCVTRFSAVRHRLDPEFPTRTLCRQRVKAHLFGEPCYL